MRRLAFLIAFVTLSASEASSFVEVPFEESVAASPVIARGTIGRSETGSGKLSDGSEVPYTYWEFKVTEVLKGAMKPSGIRVRQIGGEKNGLGMTISGAAEFSPGEDVVLMLDPSQAEQGDEAYTIRELALGKYGIERDEDGKEYLVGAGIGGDSNHAGDRSRRHRLALDEVRKIIADQKSNPTTRSRPSPSVAGGGGLLGESTSSPATSKPSGPEVSSSETDETKAGERTSRAWILVVGAALGAFFYWLKKRKR